MNIRLNNITKSFGEKTVLRDFSCEIELGDTMVLMGPSGVGKTTLLRILAGLEHADAGTITGLPRHIGMVFQEDRLCEDYSVRENLDLVLKRKMSDELLMQHLQEIGLGETLHSPVETLSGGMKRRVAILRAMLPDNELLLMDEPFSGLDEENRARTLEYIKRHRRDRTLVLVTHDQEDVQALEGRKWVIPGIKLPKSEEV
ncbi:MAG: ATP-binding cassette domain-containing protein [Roseburia sp.]